MTLLVIGYEGGDTPDHPMLWGGAAIRGPKGVFNVWMSPEIRGDSPEEWAKTIAEGSATPLEVEIPIEHYEGCFVLSLRKDLFERAPYRLETEIKRRMRGISAFGIGATRVYYVFDSHKRLSTWLYHLHAGLYELVPVKG